MKEKIIDFFNGIFAYEQAMLKTEPEELVLAADPGEELQGSFVISSCDERRIKGILHTRIPGLELKNSSFFARAARMEYSYRSRCLREGETEEGSIWMETSAGEYELPVRIRIKGGSAKPPEEGALPKLRQPEEPELPKTHAMGKGRSDEWKSKRLQEKALAEFQVILERERRNGCGKEEADARLRTLTDQLLEADAESPAYPLLDAYVMLREGRTEEAGWILGKYEKTRLFQQKNMRIRALFLYVKTLAAKNADARSSGIAQLQKIYLKRPEDWMVTAFLLELDPKFRERSRTCYKVLERQFRAGTRSRLLYQEAWELLKKDMALFARLDTFTMQVFGWAASYGFLTAEAAQAVAGQASRLKSWSPLASRLLKACYQANPSRETAGAVCSIYIRGHRTDEEAFVWYQKGVELDARITNLYEYFIYALPENYSQLLPRQVLLYFHYHNTLTNWQKTIFYCNLVKYGTPGDPVYEEHRRLLQEFLYMQLKERRLSESLAWLYEKCLMVETLEDDLLEALADLLFLRKLTCADTRIWQVEVGYEQLEERFVVPLAGGSAYIPVYTPGADIVLVDEHGNRYRKNVPYNLKRIMIEPSFLQVCMTKLKNHLGLNLYQLDGNGTHRVKKENVDLVWRLAEDSRIRESCRLKLKLELLEYERKQHSPERLDDRLRLEDEEIHMLPREGQASYIEILIQIQMDQEALRLLEETGCTAVEPRILLRLIQRLLAEEQISEERLLPLARQVFAGGIYTERIVRMLAGECRGDTRELLELWKAGERFGLSLPELEEHLIAQALFTERYVNEVFPVFLSMDDRGGDMVIGGAYLNYLSWMDFVRCQEVPEGLFDSLEHHLLWEDRLSEIAALCYLKQLSVLLLLSDVQKRLAGRLMKELTAKHRNFAFMQKLFPCMEEVGRPDDRIVLEYRCNPKHRVILHYVLEYHGKKTFDYVTERLYPVCSGVFVRAFILFYGERLTWFFTETADDGTEISTECRIAENREEHTEGGSRFHWLCRMQRALDHHQDRALRKMMTEYEKLTELTEEKFRVR